MQQNDLEHQVHVSQMNKVNARVTKLKHDLEESRGKTEIANEKLSAAEADIGIKRSTIGQLKDTNQKQGALIEALQKQLDDLRHKVDQSEATKKVLEAAIAGRKAAEDRANGAEGELFKTKIDLQTKEKSIEELTAKLVTQETLVKEGIETISALKDTKAELEGKLKTAEGALEEARKQIEELIKEENASKARICELTANIEKLIQDAAVLSEEKKVVTTQKEEAEAECSKLRSSIETLTQEAVKQEANLNAAKIDAANWEREFKEAKEAIKAYLAELSGLRGELRGAYDAENKAREDLRKLQQQNLLQGDREYVKIKGIELAGQVTPERLKQLEGYEARVKDLERLQDQVKELEGKLSEAEKSLIKFESGKSVNILGFEYGGTNYTDGKHGAIVNKLYQHAANGTNFHLDNAFFGQDPYPGVPKTYSITFMTKGDPTVKHLVGREHDTKAFGPLTK